MEKRGINRGIRTGGRIFCGGMVVCESGGERGMKEDGEARKDGNERDQLFSGVVNSGR